MNKNTTISPLYTYTKDRGLLMEDLMPGIVFFGMDKVEELTEKALHDNTDLEFYYASDNDLLKDKLSYRFNPRKAS